jgi:hypothetical protein
MAVPFHDALNVWCNLYHANAVQGNQSNRVLKNKYQAVSPGARRFGKRSPAIWH